MLWYNNYYGPPWWWPIKSICYTWMIIGKGYPAHALSLERLTDGWMYDVMCGVNLCVLHQAFHYGLHCYYWLPLTPWFAFNHFDISRLFSSHLCRLAMSLIIQYTGVKACIVLLQRYYNVITTLLCSCS